MSDYGTFIAPNAVRFVRLLPGPLERVWSYLVEPEKRAKWFAGGAMELIPGGKILFEFNHRELSPEVVPVPEKYKEMENGMTMGCKVLEVDAPNRLVFSWGSEEDEDFVTFELTPEADKVRLTVTHENLATRSGLKSVSLGWHGHLAIFADVLEGRTPQSIWTHFENLDPQYQALIQA